MAYLHVGVLLLAVLSHAQDIPGKAEDEGGQPTCQGDVPLYLRFPYSNNYHIDDSPDFLVLTGNPNLKIDDLWYNNRWVALLTSADHVVRFIQKPHDNETHREIEGDFGWRRTPKEFKEITTSQKMQGVMAGKTFQESKEQLESIFRNNDIKNEDPASNTHQYHFTVTMKRAHDLGKCATILEEACRQLLHDQDVDAVDIQTIEERKMCEEAGHVPPKPNCNPRTPYRTADGSCNNLANPTFGMSFQPFRRMLPPDYSDPKGIRDPRKAKDGSDLVSARSVSLALKKFPRKMSGCFSVFLMGFGQFLDHDLTLTPAAKAGSDLIPCCHRKVLQDPALAHPECFPIIVDPLDPFYSTYGITCIEFVRSLGFPLCRMGPREQQNQVTAYMDGSAVYGSTIDQMNDLRLFRGGRLNISVHEGEELLPNNGPNHECGERMMDKECFKSGDARVNEHVLLTFITTLFMREHNRVAKELEKMHSDWDDEKIFQEARRIVVAILQHISYNEFLPAIIGPKLADALGLKPLTGDKFYTGYDENISAAIANAFAAAAFRMGHSLIPEIIIEKRNSKYMSSETNDVLFKPLKMYNNDGMASVMHGACTQSTEFMDNVFADQISNLLFKGSDQAFGLDLVALNIQRGRDHGLPGYTKFREMCGFKKITSFDDLREIFNSDVVDMFENLYSHPEDIDLFPAAMGEKALPGALLGPTMSCIFADQFRRLKQGDRFWYENKGLVGSFNAEQLTELHKASFSRLICDNFPAIETTQRWTFQLPGSLNPEVSCDSLCIPKLDLKAWKH